MKKQFTFLLAICLSCSGLCAQTRTHAFDVNERLGRGINMGNTFEAPTETAWGNPWKPEYFRIMAELGFSHVRIPIRWEPAARSMASPPYTIESSFLERIRQVVDTALEYKLHAIINMHHHEALFADPAEQKERFLSQWTQIADFFKDYPDSLLFEPLNEPNGLLTPAIWNEFFSDVLGQIRQSNPDRVVVMGTAEWGGLVGLQQLVLPDDPNLIVSIHYYNPFSFTHQGAEWVGEAADAWLGTKWHDTEAERESIQKEFEYAIAFGKNNQVPIHIGEFGAYNKADIESRVRWTTFLARWFEEQGFSWAYWEFSAGFGIYNPNSRQLNTALVDALLHNPMPESAEIISVPVYRSDFNSGRDGWSLQAQQGASASLSNESGKLVITINRAGTEGWHVQLIRSNIPLKSGSMYRVKFKASAAQQRQGTVYVGIARSPWSSYSGSINLNLETEENDYSFTFTMASADPAARLVFDLGTNDSDFFLSSLTLDEISLATYVDEPRDDLIRIYPNPVNQYLKVENLGAYYALAVYDMLGKRHFLKHINGNQLEIDAGHFPSGLYVGKLLGNKSHNSFTFLKL